MSKHIKEIAFADGRTIFQSYGVTVAAYLPGRGYVRTEKVFNVTTQNHINRFLGVTRPDRVTPRLKQAELIELTAPLYSRK